MPRPADKILVVRNDKLGDFVLALPCFHLLKRALPRIEVHALASGYTAPLARACPAIDRVVVDPGRCSPRGERAALVRELRAADYGAMLALLSTWQVAVLGARLGIPYRLAPATKVWQFLYGRRLRQRRSRSEKPESDYNLELVERFLRDAAVVVPQRPAPPFLEFDAVEVRALCAAFRAERGIPDEHRLVFVHPGSGGSARNLDVRQFARFARALRSAAGHTVVVTAGPGETERARAVATELGDAPHVVYESTGGIVRFAQHVQFADVFVGGSTGPLHVAGALDRPTVGFYSNRRSATSLRWQTLSRPDRRIALSPPPSADPEDMGAIDVDGAARLVSERFLRDA